MLSKMIMVSLLLAFVSQAIAGTIESVDCKGRLFNDKDSIEDVGKLTVQAKNKVIVIQATTAKTLKNFKMKYKVIGGDNNPDGFRNLYGQINGDKSRYDKSVSLTAMGFYKKVGVLGGVVNFDVNGDLYYGTLECSTIK